MPPKTKHLKKPVKAEKDRLFPIVGIGASAGGLEAIEGLFSNMPPQNNLAFVVIQHLAPNYKSIMADLLAKHTRMKVVEITDGVRVEPNVIYLNQPNKDVAIVKRTLYLMEPDISRAPHYHIDYFFRSLAQDQGERAIGIVLSGTGTDGTLGIKAIKSEGGVVMAQEEGQAKYSGMPSNAINTGLIDYILPVEKMSRVLMSFEGHPYFKSLKKAVSDKEIGGSLQKILLTIRSRTGHDFSNYKQTTILRRLERRMAIHQVKNIADYLIFLRENPTEVDSLYKDFLIGVTSFFRDSDAFAFLTDKVISDIVSGKPADSVVRVWVPGCATGEEAYSIAMLLVESMEATGKRLTVQIFATDINGEAINLARQAVFPDSIASVVSSERIKRFFIKADGSYRLKKQIREMVVFAEQNIAKDPPFSKLDLVSCRNMLIYMDLALQKKIIPLFHYTLNDGGYLFLGTSESIGRFSDLFSQVSSKWKIYRRKGTVLGRTALMPEYSFAEGGLDRTGQVAERSVRASMRDVAERWLIDEYGPPSVLVNEQFDILYFFGRTDKYLSPPSGEPSFNILKMAREDLRYHLSSALGKAVRLNEAVVEENVRTKDGDGLHYLSIVVRPVEKKVLEKGTFMVVFEEKAAAEAPARKKKSAGTKEANPIVASLEQELHSTREYLQTTIEELETSNEELKSANEELQSTNEELQSTNEEMETSKEELQSTNEELTTINSELQNKLEELSLSNNDLQNLFESTEIGTIFLDYSLRIRRHTTSVTKVFNLIPTDVGRPLGDITSRIAPDWSVISQAEDVLRTLIPKSMEVKTKDGQWFAIRIIPYRTLENVIDGLVLTCSDITAQKEAELVAEDARTFAESIIETMDEPLLVLDSDLRVVSANKAFKVYFKIDPNDMAGRLVYDIGEREWDIPALRRLLETIIPENTCIQDFEVGYESRSGERRRLRLNARRIDQRVGTRSLILLTFDEVR